MNIDSWINRSVVRLMPKAFMQKEAVAPAEYDGNAIKNIVALATDAAVKSVAKAPASPRSTRARVQATLRHSGEALSPRMLRRTLLELQAVIDDRATVSPRRRVLQRFSADATGIRFLVNLRAEMQSALKGDKRLQALDVEMEYMFSTWFDVGFLELRRISWDSPASLVEKLIRYEAVHDIKCWADIKNRLDSDRRCYGFFHPHLPDEPLIFVEVALVDALADSITPLLDESDDAADVGAATTAIFYFISNTQDGLRGVSFGDSLIKRVVETLKAEFPKLRTFATLSPVPGFRTWLGKHVASLLERLDAKAREELGRVVGFEPITAAHFLAAAESPLALKPASGVPQMLLRCAPSTWATRRCRADPSTRWHDSIWAMARAWSGSTGPVTRRPRGLSNPMA